MYSRLVVICMISRLELENPGSRPLRFLRNVSLTCCNHYHWPPANESFGPLENVWSHGKDWILGLEGSDPASKRSQTVSDIRSDFCSTSGGGRFCGTKNKPSRLQVAYVAGDDDRWLRIHFVVLFLQSLQELIQSSDVLLDSWYCLVVLTRWLYLCEFIV